MTHESTELTTCTSDKTDSEPSILQGDFRVDVEHLDWLINLEPIHLAPCKGADACGELVVHAHKMQIMMTCKYP